MTIENGIYDYEDELDFVKDYNLFNYADIYGYNDDQDEYDIQREYINELESSLKSCAHCDGKPELIDSLYSNEEMYAVECIDCGMSTLLCPTIEEAVEIWNRRVDR